MKVCIVTCYKQPDYIRAKTLRTAAAMINGVEVITVKNTRTGLRRYPEVFAELLKTRIRHKPDAYLLTFRGYEMLLPVRLLSLGKPLLYDEFINPIEWVAYEHKIIGKNNPLTWALWVYYRVLLAWTDLILADTESHADLSAKMMKVQRGKFMTIPVGTDETVFASQPTKADETDEFKVFYYGNMLPLHGPYYVIDAAKALSHEPIKFVLVGGNVKTAAEVTEAARTGANIDYKPWVDFEKLPTLMQAADVCLAGPFGDTFQSQYVITGKAYQYLAMSRPIVVGANKESQVFTDKTNALVVPQGDSAALVTTILWALEHRSELHTIGQNGRKLYDEKFAASCISQALCKSLDRLGLTKLAARTDSH